MSLQIRHLRLRAETEIGSFGADIPFEKGLNVLWADNTKGKSTCLQGLLYVLGLERMLSARREIPLTYVMTSYLEDPATGQRHDVLESFVWVELENKAGEIITVCRGVKTSANTKLVSVFEGPFLTNPSGEYRKRDYFVSDPGAATRASGFHYMLSDFIGWQLPIVRRYDGTEIKLYLETIFPLIYVEQKVGWSSIPATFPTFFQIRDIGQRSVEFLLALETHDLELKRQQLDIGFKANKSAWDTKCSEIHSLAGMANAHVEGLPTYQTVSTEEIERSFLLVSDENNWKPLEDKTSLLRARLAEINRMGIPTVGETVSQTVNEIENLNELLDEVNLRRGMLFRHRQNCLVQKSSVEQRINALQEDLQKNLDAQKLKTLGSTITDAFAADHCPTCDQPIADTLLGQNINNDVRRCCINMGADVRLCC